MRFATYIFFLLSVSLKASFVLAANDCECPKLSCDVDCEVEQSLTFYTEKCAGGSRVMSCARPACVMKQNPPTKCTALQASSKVPVGLEETSAARDPASAKTHESVGRVKFIEGYALRSNSESSKELSAGDEVYENDKITTNDSGRIQIEFKSGNLLNITPGSEVVITEASDSKSNQVKKQMVLDLIKGKVRSRVNKQYDGKQSFYRVKTRAAVAGVRGTDFTVSIQNEGENVIAKVETLEGLVELSDKDLVKTVAIGKEETASYVLVASAQISDKNESIEPGYFTSVTQMPLEQISNLELETNFEIVRNVAAAKTSAKTKSDFICTAPQAKLNQCSWTCENNPVGAKKCRTEVPGVSCVRRICNANGVWSQPTRLPAAYDEACSGERAVVKPCDY